MLMVELVTDLADAMFDQGDLSEQAVYIARRGQVERVQNLPRHALRAAYHATPPTLEQCISCPHEVVLHSAFGYRRENPIDR
jgi:hypothetical protein